MASSQRAKKTSIGRKEYDGRKLATIIKKAQFRMTNLEWGVDFLACRLKRQAQDVLRQLTHSLTHFFPEVTFFLIEPYHPYHPNLPIHPVE